MEAIINMNNHVVENLGEAKYNHEAVRKDQLDGALAIVNTDLGNKADKSYVDNNFVNKITGGSIGGDLDMRGHSIKFLKFDNSDSAAVRAAELNLKLDKNGGQMNGDLNMGNNKITNIDTPTNDNDVTNKKYVDESHILSTGSKKMFSNI